MTKRELKDMIRLLRKIYYRITGRKPHNSLIDTLIPQMVEIGKGFVSAPYSVVLAHDASTFIHSGKYRVEKTIIGDNVFLGAGAIVLPGVRIGDNCIIGAGAVVTKDIPDNSVAAGNPARLMQTPTDYIYKCEQEGVLFEPPESFSKANDGTRLTDEDIKQFQIKVLDEYNSKRDNNAW